MKKVGRYIVYVTIVTLFLSILMPNITAEPTIEELTHDPTNPEILSDVSFIAKITGDDITAVHLFIQECEKDGDYLRIRKRDRLNRD